MKPQILVGHERPLTKVMFSYTGDLFFSSCKGGKMCAWDADTGDLIKMYEHMVDDTVRNRAIWDFDVTLDGSRLIVATSEGVIIYDVETGEELAFLNLDTVCKSVAWNKKPDYQWSFALAYDSFESISMGIAVYQVAKGNDEKLDCEPVLQIKDLPATCVKVDFGVYDESLISFHENGMVCNWDSQTGRLKAKALLFQKVVTSVDFTSDRTFCLCSFTTDRPLNACSISPLREAKDPSKVRMHVILAGGQSAAEVTTTKTQEAKSEVLLINSVTADQLGTIASGFSPVNSIAFFRDGSGFVLGAEEGNIRLYRFDPSYFTNSKFI